MPAAQSSTSSDPLSFWKELLPPSAFVAGNPGQEPDAAWHFITEGRFVSALPHKATSVSTQLHADYQSEFDHIEHYQKDAIQFDYFAAPQSAATQSELERLHQQILHAIDSKASRVMDLGCGNGWLARALLPSGKTVISVDISAKNVREVLTRYDNPAHFGLVADAMKLPLNAGSLDCIVASEVMEHSPDPVRFLSELAKALRPGGQLIITVPFDEHLRYHLCVHCNRPTPENAHLHSFDLVKVKSIVPKSLEIQHLGTFGHRWGIRSRLYHMLRWLPGSIYRTLDRAFIGMVNKPTRLMLIARRR